MENSIFVTNQKYLDAGGGGVQWCTREYLSSLTEAGFHSNIVGTMPQRAIASRLSRRLFPRPFKAMHSKSTVLDILEKADACGARWIFLNNTEAASMAPSLRKLRPELRLCFLSHGVEITDVVNNLRIAPETSPKVQQGSRWLGELLKLEIEIREALDAVICISEQDVFFENWLGSRNVLFVPRQIPLIPLPLSSIKGRVGVVGTWSHGPNMHGLRMLAQALGDRHGIEIRVVGGPRDCGNKFQDEFRSIHFLGALSDEDLRTEAATWRAFLNPIFCHARGASTKVATALGWGLPVITTPHGARGYRWDRQMMPLADTPLEMVSLVNLIANDDDVSAWQLRSRSLAAMAPTSPEAGELLRHFIKELEPVP